MTTLARGICFAALCAVLATGISARAQTPDPFRVAELDRTSSGWALSWEPGATNTAYTVQYMDSVQDGLWRTPFALAPFPLQSPQWTDPAISQDSRFYRVLAVPAAQRGQILSATLVSTKSTMELSFLFAIAGVPITPQYNVRLYRVVYETVTPLGARTRASGALLLPDNVGRPLPLATYQHGTLTKTNDVPSGMSLSSEVTIGIAFATTGYAAVTPDYLGLGDSPRLHPYHHARSEATAGVDMLRAARNFCAANGVALTNQLFLCGYSQGGHATMALFRELETHHTNEFSVTACASMAGAYDLSGVTTSNFLSGVSQPNPYYFLYLLGAFQEVYRIAPSLAAILRPPYDTTLPPLLNGNNDGSAINALMPADPVQILKPEYLEAFKTNPRHPLRLALQDNDLSLWKPNGKLRLYHCSGDRDVPPANSQVALANFHAAGATHVQLFDPVPGADHGSCAQPSLIAAKTWFDSLR